MNIRQPLHHGLLDPDFYPVEIAADARQFVELECGPLYRLVLQQAAHQFGARIRFGCLLVLVPRQQHARFDLNQHRRHQ